MEGTLTNADAYEGCDSQEEFFGSTSSVDLLVHPETSVDVTGWDPEDPSTWEGTIRAFISSNGFVSDENYDDHQSICGIFEVNIDLADPLNASWTEVPVNEGKSTPSDQSCFLTTAAIAGLAIAHNEKLLVYGGYTGENSSGQSNHSRGGGICIVDPDSYDVSVLIPYDTLLFRIPDLLPHPHVDGLFYTGALTDAGCQSCTIPGLYTVERQYHPATQDWSWETTKLSGNDLELRQINRLTWGGTANEEPFLTDLYLGTLGGGTWNGWYTD